MKLKEKFIELLPFLIAINIFIIIWKYLTLGNTTLMWLIPLFFLVNLLLILVLFIFNFKNIKQLFKHISKKTWLILLIIFIAAIFLRVFLAPHTHRVYYDEDIYLNIAQNIVNDGHATLCNRGTPEHCDEGVLNKQPQSLSFFLATVFLFTGVNETLAGYVMALVSAVSCLAIFFLAYLFFEKEEPALYTSIILTLTPIHALWAPTITGETLFVFFAILSIAALLAYLKNKSTISLFLAAGLLAFASQIRPEAPLLLPIAALFFLKEKLDRKILLAFILLLALFTPYVMQFNNVKGDAWGASAGEKLGFNYIRNNAYTNSKFFIENTRYPMLFTVFIIPGLLYFIIRKEYLKLSALVIWFLLFFSMYALFYAGSFNYGADVRFSLTLYASITILIASGIYYLRTILPIKKKFIPASLLVIIVLAIFYQFLPFVSAIGEEAWDARLAHDFAIKEAKLAGDNCYVFTHVPTMFLINDINALQTWYASNQQVVEDIFKKTDCVLYDEGYWCVNVAQYKDGVCKYIKDNYKIIKLNSATERGKTFTLYKVERQ